MVVVCIGAAFVVNHGKPSQLGMLATVHPKMNGKVEIVQ